MSNKERKALGKGFSALIRPIESKENSSPTPESGASQSDEGLFQISISSIYPNPKQPRKTFDQEKLYELSQSIKIKGVIQPITVRRRKRGKDEFELIAGERRLKASKLAGLEKIPAIVTNTEDEHMLELSLIENIQRHNLNPIEEGMAYQALLNEHGFTQEDLSKRLGKNRSTIANMIRLLQLPQALKEDVVTEKMSMGHARALLSVENEELQLKIRDRIVNEQLSVRETEKLLKQKENEGPSSSDSTTKTRIVDLPPQMVSNQERLRERFATKVVINSKGEKGKIEIEYYNAHDFNRIFSLLLQN